MPKFIAALTSLSYSVVEARAALQSLPAEEMPIEERVRKQMLVERFPDDSAR